MKRYDEYIEINSPWIKNIPMNWNAKRLKSVAAYISRGETPVYTDDTSCTKVINQATFSQGYWNTKKVRYTSSSPIGNESVPKQRDILLASTGRGVLGKVFYFDQSDTYIADGHVTIIRTCKTLNSRFLYYYLSVHFDTINGLLARGSTNQTELQEYSLKNMPVPLPSADEQDQIVRYLDWQVSKINRLIAAKRKRIELVKEHFSVRIANIVCNGLKPNTPMRETGIDYIGAIPSHWTVLQNKRLFKSMNRTFQGIPTVLSLSQKDGLIPYSEMTERSLHTSSYENWQLVCPNDLVLNRFKAHLGVFFASKYTGIVTFHYGVYEAKMPLVAKYYEVLYHTPEYCRVYAGQSRGMTVGLQNLSDTNFYSTYTVYPPNEEQREIVTEIEQIEKQQSSIIAGVNRQIEKLQEFRTRLISDVVTGQVDVRGIEVPDFEYVGEADVAGEQDEGETEGEADG